MTAEPRPAGAQWKKRHPIPAPDWRDPADRYCHYCSKQYANLTTFRTHVVKQHGEGLAKRLGLAPVTEEEQFKIEWGLWS